MRRNTLLPALLGWATVSGYDADLLACFYPDILACFLVGAHTWSLKRKSTNKLGG
jgi:hypothetical protein